MKLDKNTKVLIQGLGKDGTFQARRSIEYGTNVVACVHPKREGTLFDENIPSVNSSFEKSKSSISKNMLSISFLLGRIIPPI